MDGWSRRRPSIPVTCPFKEVGPGAPTDVPVMSCGMARQLAGWPYSLVVALFPCFQHGNTSVSAPSLEHQGPFATFDEKRAILTDLTDLCIKGEQNGWF